jgi:hypothetical protein
MLHNLRDHVSLPTLLSVYHAFISSHIIYSILFWGSDNNALQAVFILQKRCVRTIKGMRKLDSCRSKFKELNILTVPSLYIHQCAMYKRQHPNSFVNMTDISPYNTRNCTKSFIKPHKTTFYKSSPYYQCQKIYDNLPDSLKNEKCNIQSLKIV